MVRLSSVLFLVLLFPVGAFAVEAELPAAKPRIALVLGGGGARGAAHIGVLEVLERERIPIDCVVGTSMGALVAGSYAAGLSPQSMREKLGAADWTDMFLDSADYSQLSYRKKRVTQRYLSGTEIGLTEQGLQLQPGVVAGEKIKLFFNQLVGADLGEREIQNLSIPIAIIATDIGTGEKVVLRSGSLTQAMRASMSVPGLMAPVEYDGHKLVDGGLVDNLPIGIARDVCKADVIIAVNVGSLLKPAGEIGSLVSVTSQMIGILTKQNVERSLVTLTGRDIYIAPELNDIRVTDFSRYEEAAKMGRQAAEQQLRQLQPLSVSEKDYLVWAANNKDIRNPVIQIDAISIDPLKRVNPEFLSRQIRQKESAPLNRVQLEQDLIRAYGDGYYESVDYRIYSQGNKNVLNIIAREKNWSSDYITFGFAVDNEYRKGSSLNLRSAYRSTWLNHYGGELFATADIGSKPAIEIDFYQPLDPRQRYFIEPVYFKGRETIGLYSGEDKVADYKLITSYAELSLGRNVGLFGQSKIGWREYRMKGDADISAVVLPNVDENYGGVVADFILDGRNRLYFPSRGWSGHISYFDSQQQDYTKLSTDINFAYPMDKFVLAGRGSYVRSINSTLPIYDAVMLGGFLNLSGYASNQILGDEAVYYHVRGERIVGHMPLGLSGDMRLGLGFETARLRTNYTMADEAGWLNSAVIYLGGETPLGPAYVGSGFTFHGDFNLYFQVGAF